MKFDHSQTHQLIYQNELLKLTVLGGIKLEGLDRMRITLKIELKNTSIPPLRHNLDLYNDNQLEKLIRKTAEKLEIGTSVIAASLAELTESLESYRLEEIKKSEAATRLSAKVLSAREIKEAKTFLKSPGLLNRTNKMIGQSGIIGEENNRLLMYLIFTSRKREMPLHIVSLGSSGIGKSHLQGKVSELMPEEDRIEITSLSENALYYEGRFFMRGKILLVEDLDGIAGKDGKGALYLLRELMSKKWIKKRIVQRSSQSEPKTVELIVEGPVCVAGCTTHEQIYEDNANRSFLIYLDESKAQDKRVMDYQRAIFARQINRNQEEKAAELLRNTQRILEPIGVVNPYAHLLEIPPEILKPRRTNNHYLQFIEVVTHYHQFQRERKTDPKTGEIYIETTLEDVKEANFLLKEILLRKSDELSGACRNYFERLKSYLETSSGPDSAFSNLEIRKALKVNPSNQKRYNLSLVANGFLRKVEGKKGTVYSYEVVTYDEFNQLREQVCNVLDENLRKLDRFTGSVPVH